MDSAGKLIGVNTAIFTNSVRIFFRNVGFAGFLTETCISRTHSHKRRLSIVKSRSFKIIFRRPRNRTEHVSFIFETVEWIQGYKQMPFKVVADSHICYAGHISWRRLCHLCSCSCTRCTPINPIWKSDQAFSSHPGSLKPSQCIKSGPVQAKVVALN